MVKRPAQSITNDQRVQYAELLRERIYSTITLLAVLVVLWQHPDDQNAWAAIGTIIGTVGALWLATIVASRMSYRIAQKDNELESHYTKSTAAASGLLAPAITPVLLILVSMTGLISLKTALLLGIISLLLSLFLFSLMSGRKLAGSTLSLLLYSLLQTAIGLGIVLFMMVVK